MKTTNPELNRQMIYSVFVRNHTKEGTFAALEKDLDRIKSLGTEILWLMPLYPVGKVKRKGKDGSPYAIADYEQTNPEMGTVEEFEHLVKTAHEKGMKVIVDVVYNHTSPDSKLYENHPEWFYKDENGEPSSLVKDWS
ncbi:MAG: alpha-galactosidase, partial [Ileibacterium sp.]|nr:alpha-galactosidase [Ileibacterium sp.]